MIDGKVYDLTEVSCPLSAFLAVDLAAVSSLPDALLSCLCLELTVQFAKEDHPGGSHPIHRVAGRDATGVFMPIHPPGTIENGLDPEKCLGNVDPLTMPKVVSPVVKGGKEEERKIELSEIIGIPDFDVGRDMNGSRELMLGSGAEGLDEQGMGVYVCGRDRHVQ